MNNKSLQIDKEQMEYLEDVILRTMASLPDLGIKTRHARFPFSLHHEYYKTRLRIHGRRLRHEEVAIMLNKWASEQEFPVKAYIWQAITGAIANLYKNEKPDLHEFVQQGMNSLAHGSTFEAWAKEFLKKVDPETD